MKKNTIKNLKIFIPTFIISEAAFSLVMSANPFKSELTTGYKTEITDVNYEFYDDTAVENSYTLLENKNDNESYLEYDDKKIDLSMYNTKDLKKLAKVVKEGNFDVMYNNYPIFRDEIDNGLCDKMHLRYVSNVDTSSSHIVPTKDTYKNLLVLFAAFSSGLMFTTILNNNSDDNKKLVR